MLITIHCAKCSKQYKVDEKLAGKRVKCAACGTPILVTAAGAPAEIAGAPASAGQEPPDREPDIFGLAEADDSGDDLASVAVSASQVAPKGRMQMCPSCKASVAKSSVICLSCGYNFRSGRGGHAGEIPLKEPVEEAAPKKRARRAGGSDLLNSIDGYLAIAVFLLVAGGLAAWMIHVINAAPAFSIYLVLPTVVTLALIFGVVAPLLTLAIRAAAYFLKLAPRHDSYNRLLMVLLLPLGMSLLCGAQMAQNPALADAVSGAWLAAAGLFFFLFRGELKEVSANAGAALAGLLVAWGVVMFVSMLVPLVTGPLYADALPPGPWGKLATGHSPALPVPPKNPTPPADSPDKPDAIKVATLAPPSTPDALFPGATGQPDSPSNPSGTASPANVPPDTTVPTPTQVVSGSPPVAPAFPDLRAKPPAQVASLNKPALPPEVVVKPVRSPFLTDIQTDVPELQGARDVISPLTPSTWMLSVKNLEAGTVTVQRWATEPLAKRGELTYQEVAKQPNSYALSPAGTHMVVLLRFPKWQLEIANFDGKPARKVSIMDNLPAGELDAVPGLVGFIDPNHFMLRWDLRGRSCFEVHNCPGGDGFRRIVTESFDTGVNDWAMSPDGRSVAILNRMPGASKQVLIYDTMGAQPLKKFSPMTMDFVCKGLAFSPDGKKIAIYAVAKEATTVLGFSVAKGESLYTAILPTPEKPATDTPATDTPAIDTPVIDRSGIRRPVPRRPRVTNVMTGAEKAATDSEARGLLWLKTSGLWLVDGQDLYDPESGRKVGAMNVPNITDQRMVGADSVALLEKAADDTQKVILGKLDEVALRNAVDALKKR